MNSLVSGWKLQVDADTAVLAAVGSARSRTSGHDVLVEAHVKDGSSGIDVDIGVARGTARSNGSDIEDLDFTGGRRRRRDDPSADRTGEEEATEETHLGVVGQTRGKMYEVDECKFRDWVVVFTTLVLSGF